MTIDELRAERNNRLSACDHYFLADLSPLINEGERATMELYRQQLRDLPAAYVDLDEITEVEWPAIPPINYNT